MPRITAAIIIGIFLPQTAPMILTRTLYASSRQLMICAVGVRYFYSPFKTKSPLTSICSSKGELSRYHLCSQRYPPAFCVITARRRTAFAKLLPFSLSWQSAQRCIRSRSAYCLAP